MPFVVLALCSMLLSTDGISHHGRFKQLQALQERDKAMVSSAVNTNVQISTQTEYEPDDTTKALKFKDLGELRYHVAVAAGWTDYDIKQTTWFNTVKNVKTKSPYEFSFDNVGRPILVTGMVDQTIAKMKLYGAASKYTAHPYCVANYWFSTGGQKFDGQKWELGHIVAKEMGGIDVDPMNFFPQTTESNHGVWYRIERMVTATDNTLKEKVNANCNVWIEITFVYDGHKWYPKGGSYSFEVEEKCAAGLIALAEASATDKKVKIPKRAMATAKFFATQPAAVTKTATISAVRDGSGKRTTTTGPGRRFTYNWLNQVELKPTDVSHPLLFPGKDWPDVSDD